MLHEQEKQISLFEVENFKYPKTPSRIRQIIYPLLVILVYAAWFSYMAISNNWHLFQENWPVSVTMTLGSFVAGATAEGGAAVAFPVFTKVLHIPASDARTFGLMIQAVGMTMAAVVIMARRITVLPRVITWVSLGGIFGQIFGTFFLHIPNPYPKILFTFVATAFGVALVLSHWWFKWPPQHNLPGWDNRYRFLFFSIGILGGSFAAQTGSGIDMLTFIVLTLAFGINEKISTPTTVTIMGLNSIVGFFLHGAVSQDIGVAWDYWLVAVPIVILGAPFGAYAASKVSQMGIVKFLLFLIGLELATTLWLIPFTTTGQVLVTGAAVAICALMFATMLRYRHKRLGEPPTEI